MARAAAKTKTDAAAVAPATIKFAVMRRWSAEVAFTAEIECADDTPTSIKLGLAIKWAVKTGADLSGADLLRANLSGADLLRANLSGANLSGAYLLRANLSGANLSGADLSGADLSGAYLLRANLSGAYLSGADLSGAYLSGADLSGAYLAVADLSGAYLTGAKIVRKVAQVRRDDGYEFVAFALDDGRLFIRAGCQSRTIESYREHIAASYPGTAKAVETLAILDFIEARCAATGGRHVAEQVSA